MDGGRRSLLVGTSTKMNLTSTEARTYLLAVRSRVAGLPGIEPFVLPPFTSIWVAREVLAGSPIGWGAQDVHPDDAGAHTGDVSAAMLADLGCRFVECGHSERRRDHAETDAQIARKVAQVVRHGMVPLLCVGEPAAGAPGPAAAHVEAQVAAGLALLDPGAIDRVVVAYEPVWAIGVGAASAGPGHVAAVHAAIHRRLAFLAGRPTAARVIYGGSVDPDNAPGVLAGAGVDGVFIGRSALDPARFASIAAAASRLAAGDPSRGDG